MNGTEANAFIYERTDEMTAATQQKIQILAAVREVMTKGIEHLAQFDRTAGTRALLVGMQANLAEAQAIEHAFLADVLQIRRESTK
jgi:hypothetical protein